MSRIPRFLFPILVLLMAAPAFAEEAPLQDRDARILELRQLIERQQQQIDELQQTVRQLQAGQPPAGQAESGRAAGQPPVGQAEAAQAPTAGAPVDELEGVDPGPEPPPPAPVQAQASGSGTGSQPAMNPNISVIGLFGGQAGGPDHDENKDKFYVDELELAVQAPVDPTTHFDAYLTWHGDEGAEIDEAFATYLGLPGGLQARGGLFLADLGRINPLHTHAWPQIDRPLPVQEFLGRHMRSPGAEVSWLAPLPWYSKATVQVTSRFGDAHGHGGEEEGHEEFTLFPAGGSSSPLYVARLENMVDLDEDTTLMLGLSGATSKIQDGTLDNASLGGADLTLKWRPLDGQGENLVWTTETLFGKQRLADPEAPLRTFNGWYSFLNYQWDRNWKIGARYDETDLPLEPGARQRRATALLEYIPSEWNALRLQYSRYNPNFGSAFDEFRIQWNLSIGPHGSHKY